MRPNDTDRALVPARVLLDGSLLLRADQTGIAAYTRALAEALRTAGAHVDLLLGGAAQPLKDAPGIAMASQVFGRTPHRSARIRALELLWRTRFGLRRRLPTYPVSVAGMAVNTLDPRMPPHDALFNASEIRDHAHMVFALTRAFTNIVIDHRISAMHWAGPVPIEARGVPNVYTLHDIISLRFPHFDVDASGRSARLHAMIARRADHIIATSERSREDLLSILGLPAERISVVYQHSVPPPLLRQEDAERLIADIYGAEPGQYAFFCGAMEPKKNLYRLIEAFTLADAGLQLLLAGPLGWLYDDVQGLLSRVGNAHVRGTNKPLVQHLGYLPRRHITALMQCCSFFAFPSIYEGFGIPVLEAMQVGVPVLTSTGGSLPEVAGDAAVLVDPLDVPGMTREIRELASDWDKRIELAAMGRQQATKFSLAAHADQLSVAYRRLGILLTPATAPAVPSANPEIGSGPVHIPPPVTHYGSYDIAEARRTQRIDGLALIFFMGLGDYLIATPMLEALRQAYPDLPIYGYASSTPDEVNSHLLAGMLRSNPNIDQVFIYRGRKTQHWKNYDFSDALKDVPANFLVLPVLYNDTDRAVTHRFTSLLQTFHLPLISPVPRPALYPEPLSEPAQDILLKIRRSTSSDYICGIVCCHFDVRSSGYVYPYGERLVRGLIASGYFVVSFSKLNLVDDNLLVVDVTTITPNDTAGILRALKSDVLPLCMVTVNSMMWAMSAGLDIRNLGLQNVRAAAMHQFLYPNISVITNHRHPFIQPERLFLAPSGSFTEEHSPSGLTFVTYRAGFVLDCFKQFARTLSS
jgi:glycosyltransferase involved in cell wall biosynthesis